MASGSVLDVGGGRDSRPTWSARKQELPDEAPSDGLVFVFERDYAVNGSG